MRITLLFIALTTTLFVGCKNESEEQKLRKDLDFLHAQNDSLNNFVKKNEERINYIDMMDSYGVELLQIGGWGSHQVEVQAFWLTEHGYLDNPKSRIKYYFNNAGDIIWISPVPGYYIEKVNRILKDGSVSPIEFEKDDNHCPLNLFDQMQNKFNIIMKKSSFEKYQMDKKEYAEQAGGEKTKKNDNENVVQETKKLKNKTINEKSEISIPTGNEESAINAIKYMLKMYHPEVKYSAIRTVKQSDATVDVILDIPGEDNYHKYYNVSTFSDGSSSINKDWGLKIY